MCTYNGLMYRKSNKMNMRSKVNGSNPIIIENFVLFFKQKTGQSCHKFWQKNSPPAKLTKDTEGPGL